jgi:hypothetical protein
MMQRIRDTSGHSGVAARSALFQVSCPLLITLQRHNTENSKQIFPEKELGGHSPDFHIQVSVSDLYISTIDLPYSAAGKYVSLTDT